MSFLGEIRRRKIFQVAAVYAVVAWLLVQIVATVEAPLNLPDWADTLVILLLAIGFPITLIISWAFNLTPEGLVKDTGSALQRGRTIEYVLIGLVMVAVGWLVYRVELEPGSATRVAPDVLPNSVAVLPFENLSPDADDAYFAAGLHEEVLNQLAKLKNLNVIARTTMRQYENTVKPIEQVAAELNVASVMEGSVRYADGRVRVTAQLIDGQRGVHLWSDTYERDFEDIFAIESDVAMSVANAMAVEFSLAEQAEIEEVPTNSLEAYELFLSSRVNAARGTREGVMHALEGLDRAVELDPDFALGWTAKASAHTYATNYFPEQFDEQIALAQSAARRALEIEPASVRAHIPLAMIAAARGQWQQAGREFRTVSALGASEPFAAFQFTVGHIEQAYDDILSIRERDPLNSDAAWWVLAGLDSLGEADASLMEYERGKEQFGEWSFGHFHAFVTLLGSNNAERAMELARDELSNVVIATALEHLSVPDAAIAALRRLLADDATADRQYIALLAAHFGDQQLASEALRDRINRFPIGAHLIWRPVFRQVRQRQDFKDFLREQGFVAYWQEFGWPDFCRPLVGADFECS